MNDKTAVKGSVVPEENMPSPDEMEELKRDMRSAQWTHWAQTHQKQIIASVVAVLLILIAGGVWQEHNRSQRAAAATLYQQAVNEQDAGKQKALMQSVITQFGSSTYSALAEMQMGRLDQAHAEAHLQALMDHPAAMKEWVWQARLDLAELKIEQGDKDAAMALLAQQVGDQYQQLRHYLMAMASSDAAEKEQHLQKALDSVSHDNALRTRIKTLMTEKAS
ncbi:MAG: YfgM family protein [Mariprofundus sp.]